MPRSRLELLRETALFGATDDSTITFLLERACDREVASGDYFFREGDPGRDALLLESGSVEVLKSACGREHRLRELVAGDCFGEVALLDFGPRSASIRAREDCRAIAFTALDLRELARRDAEQFALIYMNLGRELSRRLRAADDRLFRARIDGNAASDDYAFAAALL